MHYYILPKYISYRRTGGVKYVVVMHRVLVYISSFADQAYVCWIFNILSSFKIWLGVAMQNSINFLPKKDSKIDVLLGSGIPKLKNRVTDYDVIKPSQIVTS